VLVVQEVSVGLEVLLVSEAELFVSLQNILLVLELLCLSVALVEQEVQELQVLLEPLVPQVLQVRLEQKPQIWLTMSLLSLSLRPTTPVITTVGLFFLTFMHTV
jgi:hypothetical protein